MINIPMVISGMGLCTSTSLRVTSRTLVARLLSLDLTFYLRQVDKVCCFYLKCEYPPLEGGGAGHKSWATQEILVFSGLGSTPNWPGWSPHSLRACLSCLNKRYPIHLGAQTKDLGIILDSFFSSVPNIGTTSRYRLHLQSIIYPGSDTCSISTATVPATALQPPATSLVAPRSLWPLNFICHTAARETL